MSKEEKENSIAYLIEKKAKAESIRDSIASRLAHLQQGVSFTIETILNHERVNEAIPEQIKIRLADEYLEIWKVTNQIEVHSDQIKDLSKTIRFMQKQDPIDEENLKHGFISTLAHLNLSKASLLKINRSKEASRMDGMIKSIASLAGGKKMSNRDAYMIADEAIKGHIDIRSILEREAIEIPENIRKSHGSLIELRCKILFHYRA